MRKQFLFYILILGVTLTHAMDSPTPSKKKNIKSRFLRIIHIKDKKTTSKREPVNPFFDYNILGCITQEILTLSTANLKEYRTNIRELSRTNSILHNYYTSEKIGQNIIRTMAIHHNESDLYMAGLFGYQQIRTKIFDLMYKCKDENTNFTQEDLQDAWYLNSTYSAIEGPNKKLRTLLLTAIIENMDAKKTRDLIAAGADCNNNRCINPIVFLTGQNIDINNYKLLSETAQKKYFAIISLLLEKKMDPDARHQATLPTLLHRAVCNGDQVFARLLLQHGANPYKLSINLYNCPSKSFKFIQNHCRKYSIDSLYTKNNNEKKPWKLNAFLLETGEPKGWLKTMYDETKSTAGL